MSIRAFIGVCVAVVAFIRAGRAVADLIPEERPEPDRIGTAMESYEDREAQMAHGATAVAALGTLYAVGRAIRR